jgi:hypothetical protein
MSQDGKVQEQKIQTQLGYRLPFVPQESPAQIRTFAQE